MKSLSDFFSKKISTGTLAKLFCLITALTWLAVLWYKFAHLAYYDWDFSLHANVMWNLSHGSVYSSLYGTNFLTNHAEYFAFLLAPIYAIFMHPFFLIVLKIAAFCAAAYFFYLLAKDLIGEKLGLIFMLLYIIYPPNIYMLLFEFNFENLAVLFIFLLFFFLKNGNFPGYVTACLLAALLKENVALLTAFCAIPAFFLKKEQRWRWALTPLLIGGGIFILSMLVITPYLRGLDHNSANQYLGFILPNTPENISLSEKIINSTRHILTRLADQRNVFFLKELLGPVNILPFLSPQILIAGFPTFLQCLLWPQYMMKTIFFHYTATVVPIIFLAAVTSLKFLQTRFSPRTWRLIVLLTVLSCLIASMSLPWEKSFQRRVLAWKDHEDYPRRKAVSLVPPDAGAIATFDFLPPLTQRRHVYGFYKIWLDHGIFTPKKVLPLPAQVTYALFDWSDMWYSGTIAAAENTQSARLITQRITDFFINSEWRVRFATNDIMLFEKGLPGAVRPVEISRQPFALAAKNNPSVFQNKIKLLDAQITPEQGFDQNSIPVRLTWHAEADIDRSYFVKIMIKLDRQTVARYMHQIGYGIYPTYLWKKGEYLQEYCWVAVNKPIPLGKPLTIDVTIVDQGQPWEQ